MTAKHTLFVAIRFGSHAVMTACARTPGAIDEGIASQAAAPIPQARALLTTEDPVSPSPVMANAEPALTRMVVNKSASCGCCGLWVDHMRRIGFEVEVRNSDNINPVKERVGVPVGKDSCHTAEVGGYFIEGHVPAEDVIRLLAQKPDGKGMVLPGMPAGSPSMEMPDGTKQPYTVELVARDGSFTAFAQH